MHLCDEGDRLRRLGREAEARVAFRRACALEARCARAETTAWSKAILWRSAGWCAVDAGRVGAALRCVENGFAALAGASADINQRAGAGLRELREAIAEAQVQGGEG